MTTISKLTALLEAATKGPWSASDDVISRIYAHGDENPEQVALVPQLSDGGNPNATLIAAMRNALPALLAVAKAAKWVANVWHGVGKAGGAPEPGEAEDADHALRDALAALEEVQL